MLRKLSIFHQPSLPTPGTPAKGATAVENPSNLCKASALAQSSHRVSTAVSADSSHLHSQPCCQNTAATNPAVPKHCLTQGAACRVEFSSWGLFCACQPVGIQFLDWAIPHSFEPTEHTRACAEVQCSLPKILLKEREMWVGSASPGATFVKGGREDTWVFTCFGQTTSQTHYSTGTASRAQSRRAGRNHTTDSRNNWLWGRLGEITNFTTCFDHWIFPRSLDNSRTWSHQSKQGVGYTGLNILKTSDILPGSKQTQGLKLWKSSQKLKTPPPCSCSKRWP